MVIRILLNPKSVDMESVTTLAQAQAGARFRNRRAAEAIARDTALPETGAEGEGDIAGLAGNTALSVSADGKRYFRDADEVLEDFIKELEGVELNEEQRGIYDVVTRKKKETDIRKRDLRSIIKFRKGSRGKGGKKIITTHYAGLRNPVTAREVIDMGIVIRHGTLVEDGTDAHPTSYHYEYISPVDGAKLTLVVDRGKKGDEEVINYYSNRKVRNRGQEASSGSMTSSSENTIANPGADVKPDNTALSVGGFGLNANARAEMEVRDVQILKSVSAKKAGAPTQVVTPREQPANNIIVANLKEAWESIFLSGMEQHLKQKEAKPQSGLITIPPANTALSVGDLHTGARMAYGKPDSKFIGSGEGAQVFGWGHYSSNRKGVARDEYAMRYVEDFQKRSKVQHKGDPKSAVSIGGVVYDNVVDFAYEASRIEEALHNKLQNYERIEKDEEGNFVVGDKTVPKELLTFIAATRAALVDAQTVFSAWTGKAVPKDYRDPEFYRIARYRAKSEQDSVLPMSRFYGEMMLRGPLKSKKAWAAFVDTFFPKVERVIPEGPRPSVINQTWWTHRPKGDESHLLNWYEPLSEENWSRVLKTLEDLADEHGAKPYEMDAVFGRGWRDREVNGESAYIMVADFFRHMTESDYPEKDASEALYAHDIDGVKYPVDTFSNDDNMDGRLGWNYVAFSDEHLRVDSVEEWNLETDRFEPRPVPGNTALSVGEPKRGDTIVRRTTFDVEDDEGRNVGFRYYVSGTAIAAASLLIDDKSTYVERLDVDDKYQNMGFGTRILQQLADEYGDVYVAPDNEDAKRLYERIGYDEVGSRAYNESYYAVDEGYGVYSISGDSNTNIVIEGEDDGTGNVALSAAMLATGNINDRFESGADVFRTLDGIKRTTLPTIFPDPVRKALADWMRENNSTTKKTLVTKVLEAIPEERRFYVDSETGRKFPLSNSAVNSVLFGHTLSPKAVAGKTAFLLAIPTFSERAVQVYSEGRGDLRFLTYAAPVSHDPILAYGTATLSGAGNNLTLHDVNYFDPSEETGPARTTTVQRVNADRRGYSNGPNTKKILKLIYENQALSRDELDERIHELGGNVAMSVGERPGRAPTVEPGGDVREAGEGALAWLRRKFVHSQTPVFDAVRRVMGVGREPPDALNVEAAAKNVHGKIRARQEMLQRAYLEPLKAILAQPGMDRKRFDDYALALHALERNRMIQERSVVVDPTTGEVVDLGVEAGSGVTNAWAERVIREIQRAPFAEQYKEAANILAEMNRFVLRGVVADGLLTEAQARTWMRLSPHYVPLILSRLRACYRTQDAPGEAWKFGGLEVWLWRPVLVVLLVLFVLPRV